jgi:hypothetical protein
MTSRDQINPQDQSIKASNLFGLLAVLSAAATWQAGWVQNTKRPGVVCHPNLTPRQWLFEEVLSSK